MILKTRKISNSAIKCLLLGFLLLLNIENQNPLPLTISLVVLYSFYLEHRINTLYSEIQKSISGIDKDTKQLFDNQKLIMTLINSFKNDLGKIKKIKNIDNKSKK